MPPFFYLVTGVSAGGLAYLTFRSKTASERKAEAAASTAVPESYSPPSRLYRSQKATDLRLDNTPPAHLHGNLWRLEKALNAFESAHGPVQVRSGYRSEAVNRAVGGSPGSLHMQGLALDIAPLSAPSGRQAALADLYHKAAPFFRWILVEPTWLHCEL